MSDRGAPARPDRLARRWRTPGRRARVGLAVGSVAILLAAAGVIGSGGVDSDASSSSRPVAREATVASSGRASSGADGAVTADEGLASGASGAGGGGDGDASATTVVSGAESAATDTEGASGTGNRLEPKIVRTGSLDLVVKRGSFDRAAARLTTLATGAGGFVSASQTSALDDAPQGTITLRVPVDRFDDVVAQVRELGTVASLTTGSQDVTGEYSDVAARIKALRDEREQITLVLGRAETIPDILSVRDRLAVVQSELEQLQGRQQVLDDQTSLSTLAVSLREKGRAPADTAPPTERTGLDKLWHDAGDRFTDGARAIALGLATLAPWVLLALVLFLPARIIWRRLAPSPA